MYSNGVDTVVFSGIGAGGAVYVCSLMGRVGAVN